MKKSKIVLSMLAVFALGMNSTFALEAEDGWTKYEAGTTPVEVDKLKFFENDLSSKVEELNKLNSNNFYRYRLDTHYDNTLEDYQEVENGELFESEEEAQEWADNNQPLEEGWSFQQNLVKPFNVDNLFTQTRYETEEEAIKAANDFDSSVTTGGAIVTEVRDENGDSTNLLDYDEKFYTEEEAIKAAQELEEDTHNYLITAKVISLDPEFDKTDTVNIQKTFDTKAKAEAYVEKLKEEYDVVEVTIKEVNETSSLNETYDTKEDAEKALEEFLAKYPQTKVYGIEEVRDTTEDTSVTVAGTTEYASEAEAKAQATKLNEDNSVYQVVASTRKGSKTVTTAPETVESEQFDTETEAQNYIDSLKKQGYDVSNLEVVLVPFEETIWEDEDGVVVDPGESDGTTFTYNHFDVTLLTQFTKISAEGNESTVTGSIAINSVKINNNSISMNGPSKDPNTRLTEYTSTNRRNLNVTNRSLVEISGTVTYNKTTLPFTIKGYLSESQNVCGGKGGTKGFDLEFKSVTIVNNKVLIDTNIINKYKVTGTMTKTTTQDVWYVDTTKITKGYDYKVNADGVKLSGYSVTGTASKDIYKDVYSLEVSKTTKDYDYIVNGSGIKTYYKVSSQYVRLTDAEWIIEMMPLSKDENVEVLPPQTGITSSNCAYILFILTVLMVILNVKLFAKEN